MSRLPWFFLLAPLAALVLVLGAAGCGDDNDEDGGDDEGEELTLEEYYDQLEGIAAQFDADRVAIEAKYPEAFDTAEATRLLFEEAWPLLARLVTDLEAMNPPAEVEDAHARTIVAANDSATFLQNTAVVLETATDEDLPGLVENAGSLVATLTRLQNACLAQQSRADRFNIAVNLKCPRDD